MTLLARIEAVSEGVLRGWALDDADMSTPLELLVLVDGREVARARADRKRGDLQRHFSSGGAHGFECPLPLECQDGQPHQVTLRLGSAQEGVELASRVLALPSRTHLLQGKVERVDATQILGWVWDRARPDAPVEVQLLHDDKVVAAALAEHLRHDLKRAGIGSGRHGLVLPLAGLGLDRRRPAEVTLRVMLQDEAWVLGQAVLPPDPAQDDIRQGAKVTPEARAILAKARDAERQRQFAEAAALIEEGLRIAPRDFDLRFLRARVAMALNDFDGARQHASLAAELRPEASRPKLILARIATSQGRHDEAVDLWEDIKADDDYYRERLIKRGRALVSLGRLPEALREFLGAIRLNPADVDALRGAAQATEGLGALQSAQRRWEAVLAVVPDDPMARLRVSEMARRQVRPASLPSPMLDPWLHDWPEGVQGQVAGDWRQPTPGMRLRCKGGTARFAAAAPSVQSPGEAYRYGVWFHAPTGHVELDFALAALARETLMTGLRMGVDMMPEPRLATPDRRVQLKLMGRRGGRGRLLLEETLSERPRLFTFALKLSEAEAGELGTGGLSLRLAVAPGSALAVRPPRPLAKLEGSGAPRPLLAEDDITRLNLQRLGLLGTALERRP